MNIHNREIHIPGRAINPIAQYSSHIKPVIIVLPRIHRKIIAILVNNFFQFITQFQCLVLFSELSDNDFSVSQNSVFEYITILLNVNNLAIKFLILKIDD